MKRLFPISFVMFLLYASPSSGQSFKKYIAGTYAQRGTAIHRNTDGGCILAGSTKSFGSLGNDDLYLVRTDTTGDMMWTRTFGTPGMDVGNAVEQCADGGFLATGESMGMIYLVRTDPNGDLMWSRTYGAPVGGSGYSLAITPDSGAILVGPTAENPSNMFAIRTNDMGDTVWTRTFQIGAESNIAYSVCTVPEGGFVIAGTKDVPNTSSRMELLRIADDGNLMWNKEIHAYNWGEGRSVIATNHGFLVGGGLNNDACLLKLDPTGTTQWAMLYPSIEGEYSIAYTVQATADGGYVVSGLHDYGSMSNTVGSRT